MRKWAGRQPTLQIPTSNMGVTAGLKTVRMMHINKTAGTSVKNWIMAWSGINLSTLIDDKSKSLPYASSHIIIKDFSDRDFYFTIVRNPYDRLASHYFQWESYGWWKKEIKDLNDFVSKAYIFHPPEQNGRYIKDFITDPNSIRHQPEFILPCSDWIADWDRFTIFKTENLDELHEFFKKHGGPAKNDIGRAKSTMTKGLKSYKDLYNEESLKIIQKIFHDDFENFGYEK